VLLSSDATTHTLCIVPLTVHTYLPDFQNNQQLFHWKA